MKRGLGAALLTMTLAAGAAGAALAENKVPDPAQYSGFLGDYSQLQPAKDREGVLLYLDHSKDYHGYTKIMIDPVEVVLTPNPEYKGVRPDVLNRMTSDFEKAFKKAFEPDYQIVTAPGPDVLRLRAAITGVQVVKTPVSAVDFLPIKAVFNVGRAAAGASPHVAEMTAEMEVLDVSGNRLAAAVATRQGEKTLTQSEQVTWKNMEDIAAYWAKGMRQRLDELRGVAAKTK